MARYNRLSNSRNHRRYLREEDDDDDCCCGDCDCQDCCIKNTASLRSRAVICAGTCLILLVVIAFVSKSDRSQDTLLGGWNAAIARELIRASHYPHNNEKHHFLQNRTIYILTPTYNRPNQKSLLTALAQTFFFVDNFHWIVIEDSEKLSPWIRTLLDRFNFNFTQIACDRKVFCKRHGCKKISAKGSVPRNCGLLWLKDSGIKDGVMYFADDDNFYDVRLFNEIRNTKKVSVFPVGGFIETGLSSPVIVNGKLVKFIDPWISDRKWPVDMAGYATNIGAWRKMGTPLFVHTRGYLETKFLGAMEVTKDTLEVVGNNATEVFVWHNTIKKVACNKKSKMWKEALKDIKTSNLDILFNRVEC